MCIFRMTQEIIKIVYKNLENTTKCHKIQTHDIFIKCLTHTQKIPFCFFFQPAYSLIAFSYGNNFVISRSLEEQNVNLVLSLVCLTEFFLILMVGVHKTCNFTYRCTLFSAALLEESCLINVEILINSISHC